MGMFLRWLPLVGVRLVHVKNELAKDGWMGRKVKRVPALHSEENSGVIKSCVCTQREKSCVCACACVRVRAHVCVKERCAAQ